MLPRIPFDLRVLAVMFLALGVTHLTPRIITNDDTWTISAIVIIIISIYMYVTATYTPSHRRR